MDNNKKIMIIICIVILGVIGIFKVAKHRVETETFLPVTQATTPPGASTASTAKVQMSKDEELAARITTLETRLDELKQEQSQKIALLEKNFAGMIKSVQRLGEYQFAVAQEMEGRFAKLTRSQKADYARLQHEINSIGKGIKSIDSTIASLNNQLQHRENAEEVATAQREPARNNDVSERSNKRPPQREDTEEATAIIPISHPHIAVEEWSGQGFRDTSGDYVKVTATFSTWGAAGKNLMVKAAVRDTDSKEWNVTQGLSVNPTKEGQLYREFVVHIPYREIPKDSNIALKFYDKANPANPIFITDWKPSKDLQPFKQPLYGYR